MAAYQAEIQEREVCLDCERLHDQSLPCPVRVARELVRRTSYREQRLTEADQKLIRFLMSEPVFDAAVLLEDVIKLIRIHEMADSENFRVEE